VLYTISGAGVPWLGSSVITCSDRPASYPLQPSPDIQARWQARWQAKWQAHARHRGSQHDR